MRRPTEGPVALPHHVLRRWDLDPHTRPPSFPLDPEMLPHSAGTSTLEMNCELVAAQRMG